jgi:osmotically-inducible protein OsmY
MLDAMTTGMTEGAFERSHPRAASPRPATGQRAWRVVAVVVGVACMLAVTRPAPALADLNRQDFAITQTVRDRLLAAKLPTAGYWSLDTHDGIVYIFGAIKSPYARQRAESIAGAVPGVRGVVATLDVGPYVWLTPSY